ncbi:hypothetical protein TNCV_3029371 [Trichonephila clavipes]|nr:hypothetical protein TNCV_3029371 [Trichonephila clavipes]
MIRKKERRIPDHDLREHRSLYAIKQEPTGKYSADNTTTSVMDKESKVVKLESKPDITDEASKHEYGSITIEDSTQTVKYSKSIPEKSEDAVRQTEGALENPLRQSKR